MIRPDRPRPVSPQLELPFRRVYVDVQFTGRKRDRDTGERMQWRHGCAEDELRESLARWRAMWPGTRIEVLRGAA